MFGISIMARTVKKYGKAERNAIVALLAQAIFALGTARRKVRKQNVNGWAAAGKRKEVRSGRVCPVAGTLKKGTERTEFRGETRGAKGKSGDSDF